jgi:hypothetical protein
MRLKPEKIEQLAEFIHDGLAANSKVALRGERRDIVHEIIRVLTEDFKTEDDIEIEARKLLEKHDKELKRTGARFDQVLMKTKQKIARDRGFVL